MRSVPFQYLAAAGVGTIGIVDADEVDLSNLQRQIIHSTADIGKAKVKSAKETMEAINPDVTVKTYREFVTSENINICASNRAILLFASRSFSSSSDRSRLFSDTLVLMAHSLLWALDE